VAVDQPVLSSRKAKPPLELSTQALDRQVAMAMSVARRLRPPMKVFADEIRRELGWYSLSQRAVYAWERGEARIPAAVLIAAAHAADKSVDELLGMVGRLERMGLLPGE
jgi:transcriptional regulator with XRE-family HTH domain